METKGRSHEADSASSSLGLFLMLPCAALSDDREAAVRTAIQAFYKALDEVSWARLTTRPKIGTTSVPTGVAVGAGETVACCTQ